MRATNTASMPDYKRVFLGDKAEQESLRKELTIHTTNFFRDASLWTYCTKTIFPDIAKGRRRIRVWSAGSSTGEEAVTIAICFLESLEGRCEVSILATDRDAGTVERARKGEYEEMQFREMPPEYKEKYFEKRGEVFVPIQLIRSMITFTQADILGEKPREIDIIFCRNTVIYFSMEAKSKLYKEFYQMLPPGGYLVLGKTEILLGEARDLFRILSAQERVYIR